MREITNEFILRISETERINKLLPYYFLESTSKRGYVKLI